ncbi:MAG: hypothetical protein KDC33_13040, partial [Thermoleophilia bacterium]|nr:hypothetical protein [Thermoleophilia bacterium]
GSGVGGGGAAPGAGSLRPAAGAGGAAAVVVGACLALAAAGGSWSMPLTGTAAASQSRAPWSAWSWGDSYAAWALQHVATPGHPAFAAVIVVGLSGIVLARRAPRHAALPAAWAAWGYVYLEFVALINLTPSPRFLTLITVPLAVLVAMAADRVPVTGPVGALAAALVASVMAAAPIATRLDRERNVTRVAHVTAWLRDRGATGALSDDYVTFTKVNVFLARERLDVPRAVDPGFGGRPRRATPANLPDVAAFRGGYVVEVPPRPQGGRPANWGAFRAAVRAQRAAGSWRPAAEVDGARILRWPP